VPRIELIDVPLYDPLDPYHFEFDNLPLESLILRQELINDAVENNRKIMNDAIGTAGTVANRLNQSIEDNGDLKTSAIDDALHSIEYHTDSDDYVRMTSTERAKLALIDDESNLLTLRVELNESISSDDIVIDTGEVVLTDTATVSWEVTAPNKLKANLTFPAEAAHKHYYDLNPIHSNTTSPDYTNYKVTTSSTAFTEGSLRVYINGTRLSQYQSVYVPDAITDSQSLIKFTPNHSSGTFALSAAITEDDVIRIDFDTSFV